MNSRDIMKNLTANNENITAEQLARVNSIGKFLEQFQKAVECREKFGDLSSAVDAVPFKPLNEQLEAFSSLEIARGNLINEAKETRDKLYALRDGSINIPVDTITGLAQSLSGIIKRLTAIEPSGDIADKILDGVNKARIALDLLSQPKSEKALDKITSLPNDVNYHISTFLDRHDAEALAGSPRPKK